MSRALNIEPTRRPRATWAAVALALISCLVQGINFFRNDLKPLLDSAHRIEQKLEDHELRLQKLEQKPTRERK